MYNCLLLSFIWFGRHIFSDRKSHSVMSKFGEELRAPAHSLFTFFSSPTDETHKSASSIQMASTKETRFKKNTIQNVISRAAMRYFLGVWTFYLRWFFGACPLWLSSPRQMFALRASTVFFLIRLRWWFFDRCFFTGACVALVFLIVCQNGKIFT